MEKIGLSIISLQEKYGDREALRIAKEAGFDAVDFGLENFAGRYDYRVQGSVYAKPRDEIVEYFRDLKRYADSLGLEISQTHGRGCGFSAIKEEDEAFLINAELDCLVTAILGAPVCVIHAVTTSKLPEAEPQFMRDLNYEMFTKILPFAKKYGIKIATETFGDVHGGERIDFFGDMTEFIDSYERVCADGDNRDYFTICLDTGHTNKATKFQPNPQVPEAVRVLGERITVLHLNDNDSVYDQHLLPFVNAYGLDKTINWKDTIAALREVGYDGVFNMELFLPRYGYDVMPEFCRFAAAVLRNVLNNY